MTETSTRSPVISPLDARWLRGRIRIWFSQHGRTYPWRDSDDPYEVLVAEMLLQRTRADAVLAAYTEFILRFPDAKSLAAADPSEVIEILRSLGFTHRSARLPSLGRALVDRYEGRVPNDETSLLSLPGVGRYVANAVLVLAFARPQPLVDPNVIRLIGRCLGVASAKGRPRDDEMLWTLLAELTPARNPKDFALGLVDLGATICVRGRPRCHECPLRARCSAFQKGLVKPADRKRHPSPSQRYSKSRKASRSPN